MGIKHSCPVPPFMRYCSAIIPTMFDDSLSYYEALCALNRFIQKNLVEVVNNNASVTQEYIALTNQLKDYMEYYFDNLDVQNEINNKLDEMAEDGTLADIINAFITTEVRYIFPKFMQNAYSQDYSLVIHDEEGDKKFIMVDAGTSAQWADVLGMITSSGCSHIDYFILTHCDVDHYGNLENLINTHYIDSNTVVWLPAQVTNYPQAVEDRIAIVNNLLSINGITGITHNENAVEEIGTLKLKFGNCQKSVVEAHTTKTANATTQVVLFDHKGIKALFGGDATREVQAMLYVNNFVGSSVELFKADHHLIDQLCDENFIYSIRPTYAIQMSAIKDFVKNNYGVSEEGTILKKIGTKIYSCVMQKDYIEFTSKNGTLICNTGVPLGLSNTNVDYDYYVDTNASQLAIQDGTQEHPFTEINQAIGAIQEDIAGIVTIHVADGYYGKPHESETKKNTVYIATGKNVIVKIVGESKSGTILNHMTIVSSNVHLNNLTVDVDNGDGIRCEYNANLLLEDVNIESATDTLSTTYSALIIREGSFVQALGSIYINNCNQAIVARNSNVYISNYLSLGTINNANPFVLSNTEARIADVTFDDAEDAETFGSYYRMIKSESSILASDQDEFKLSYDLTKDANIFDYVDVYYTTNDYIRGHARIMMVGAETGYTEICNPHLGGSNVRYDKCCKVGVSGKNLTLSNMRQYAFNPANNSITCTEASNYFKIQRVYGGYF